MNVYQYVIMLKEGDGMPAQLIQDVKTVVAKDDAAVRILASRQIPEKFIEVVDNVEILVRPFAKNRT